MAEVQALAGWICDVLDDLEDAAVQQRVKEQVLALCRRFPVYGD